MLRTRLLLGLVLVLSASTVAQEAPRYTHAAGRFSLVPPEGWGRSEKAPKPGEAGILVMFVGPAKGGFAPNLNVLVDPTKSTRERYREENLAELRKAKAKVRSEKELEVSGKPAILLEYTLGAGANRNRHWTLGVIDEDRTLTVTCTAREKDAAGSRKAFEACLDSFRIEAQAPPAAGTPAEADTPREHAELGFSILQPKGWVHEVVKSSVPKVQLRTGPLTDRRYDGLLSVQRRDLGDRKPADWRQLWVRNAHNSGKNVVEKDVQLAGCEGFQVDYETKDGATKWRCLLLFKGEHYWQLESQSRSEVWARVEKELQAAIDSFKLIE